MFTDINQEALKEAEEAELRRANHEKDKKLELSLIEKDAKAGFELVKPILEKKCFDCHDANTRLPLYARILPTINPLHKHQVDGLKALDLSQGYPLLAGGKPTQLSLLKSLKNAILDRSMPLKSYVAVYRNRKITQEDEQKILAWVDPVIERLEAYDQRYGMALNTARAVMEQKCFRCHANGASKGGFGDMENPEKLFKSKFVNKKDPAASILYTISHDGKMPPNPRDALSQDELILLREWLVQESVKFP